MQVKESQTMTISELEDLIKEYAKTGNVKEFIDITAKYDYLSYLLKKNIYGVIESVELLFGDKLTLEISRDGDVKIKKEKSIEDPEVKAFCSKVFSFVDKEERQVLGMKA